MIRICTIFCTVMLPVSTLAFELAQPDGESTGQSTVIMESRVPAVRDDGRDQVISDCSGNTITIINRGTRIAKGGGNAGGVTINGNSITVDGKTQRCGNGE